jgi:hypothetical protein
MINQIHKFLLYPSNKIQKIPIKIICNKIKKEKKYTVFFLKKITYQIIVCLNVAHIPLLLPFRNRESNRFFSLVLHIMWIGMNQKIMLVNTPSVAF